MKLIGFTGAMGSGKSTAINLIDALARDYTLVNIKFAKPLYDIQEAIYQRIETVYRRPESFEKDRKLLQWIGTEFGRSLDKDLWIKLWKQEVQETYLDNKWINFNEGNLLITCDDLRFDNEAQAVKDMGGIIIKLVSDKNLERITTAEGIKNHPSEQGVDNKYLDYIIENNGNIEDLRSSLCEINRQQAIW